MTNLENPEIRGWFVPRVVPYGGAPEHIKQQWVDVPLPIRYDRSAEAPEEHMGHSVNSVFDITVFADGVSINGIDAVKSLRIFGRDEAADWWEGYFRGMSPDLAFAVESADQILPDDYVRRVLPGIEDFDQIQI